MRYCSFSLPTLLGHRGCTDKRPENTLAAIEYAATEGLSWIEFDVQLSHDKIPFLFHDDSLDRTTLCRGFLTDKDASTLAQMDAGSGFYYRKYGHLPPHISPDKQHIPNLLEALDLCHKLNLGVNIEIKSGLGNPALTTEITLDVVEEFGQMDISRVLISSFEHEALLTAKKRAPHIARGYLFDKVPYNWLSLLQTVEATSVHINHANLSFNQQVLMQKKGYPIMLYSIDNAQLALRLLARGIDSLCTGTPALIYKTAKDAGFRLQY